MEGFALGISCRDILSLLPVDSLRPAAGTDGLRNEISWVQHLESAEYIPWLKGGELVITTGAAAEHVPEHLCQMAERLMEKEAAGLVICLSEAIPVLPPALVALCGQMDFPLFEIPPEVSFLEVSKRICTAIVSQEKKSDERARLLLELIHGVRLSGKRLQKLNAIGITSEKRWCLVCIQMSYLKKGMPTAGAATVDFSQGKLSEDFLIRTMNFIQGYLEKQGQQGILFIEDENIFWLMEVLPDRNIGEYINQVLYHMKVRVRGVSMNIGVSEEFSEVKNLPVAFEHTMEALKIGKQKAENITVTFYENMIAYQLFQRVSSVKTLERMVSSILGELMLPDNGELLDTLICYINCDFSAKRTAETMFLHQNTLHYRLRKIESLLCCSLKKSDDLFDIMLAVKIYSYLKNQQ